MDPPERAKARARLAAARLVGAGAVAVLGQLAVDMPDGYFGAAETMTAFGVAYTAGLATAVLLGAWLFLRRSRWALVVAWVVLPIGVGLFLPAVPSDPVIAGGVMLWNLALLGLVELGSAGPSRPGGGRQGEWLAVNGPAVRHLALVAVAVAVLVLGFGVGRPVGAIVLCAVLEAAVVAVSGPLMLLMWRDRPRAVPAAAFSILVAAAVVAVTAGATAALAVMTALPVLIAARLIASTAVFEELIGHFLEHPGLLVLTSFALLIAVGTVLLSLPAAAPGGDRIAAVDALFTATSAACVTGLVVLDTPSDFSTFGHVVILLLIQIGGLNIMVLSAFAAVLLGRSLGLRGEAALGDVLDLRSTATAYRLVAFIVVSTALVEGLGALALGLAWSSHGAAPGEAAWNGVFHAVSAFCNAGFALQSDSLQMFRRDPLVLLVFSGLIVLGGVGFAVLAGFWWRLRGGRRAELGVQARVVVQASVFLVAAGWLVVLGLEWDRSLAGLGTADRLVNALFQSVTTRTAGFNSVALDALQPATVLIMMVLMFIGASPGGTGGGIKTTTAVVLLAAIPTLATRRAQLVLHRRRLPMATVFRASAIAVVSTVLVLATSGLLLASHDIPFESVLFEAVSAFGTVGLSLGATASLDGFGKLIVVLAMLAGRIGPLTIALLLGQAHETRLGYPEARIMVG